MTLVNLEKFPLNLYSDKDTDTDKVLVMHIYRSLKFIIILSSSCTLLLKAAFLAKATQLQAYIYAFRNHKSPGSCCGL